MREKLLKVPSNQWLKLDDRQDQGAVTELISELIAQGHKFIFSTTMTKFMRLSNDLFEWAQSYPADSEIKERNINGRKCYDLYVNGKLIAVK
jgi:hypothetical protein